MGEMMVMEAKVQGVARLVPLILPLAPPVANQQRSARCPFTRREAGGQHSQTATRKPTAISILSLFWVALAVGDQRIIRVGAVVGEKTNLGGGGGGGGGVQF